MANIPSLKPIRIAKEGLDIYSLCGLQKGIQFHKNSCYVDAALMLLFYTHEHADSELDSKSLLYPHLLPIINKIRSKPFYCPEVFPTKFRDCIEQNELLRKISIGDFMDAEEFVRTIFPHIFQRGFIFYQENIPNFVHCIINYNTSPVRAVFLGEIFRKSMSNQGLRFTSFPSPMLLIKLPYSGGKLIGYDVIIPDLTLTITADEYDEMEHEYELTGVMSYRSSNFVSYMRKKTTEGFKWLYSNSTGHNDISRVVSCESLEESLQTVKANRTELGNVLRSDRVFRDLCTTCFLVCYAPRSVLPKTTHFCSQSKVNETKMRSAVSKGVNAPAVRQMQEISAPITIPPSGKPKYGESGQALSLEITSSNARKTTGCVITAETAKFVRREVIQLMSLVLHVFTDYESPLTDWRLIHYCSNCSATQAETCLPRIIRPWKNVLDIITSAPMTRASINENVLADPTEVFKMILHVCQAPPFLTKGSENIYQIVLPFSEDPGVTSIEENLSKLDIGVKHSLIIVRGQCCRNGIIPSEPLKIRNQNFNLYGVICKMDNEFIFYSLGSYWASAGKRRWKKTSCDPQSPRIPLKTDEVETGEIFTWSRNHNNDEPRQQEIMFDSQVWIYKPVLRN